MKILKIAFFVVLLLLCSFSSSEVEASPVISIDKPFLHFDTRDTATNIGGGTLTGTASVPAPFQVSLDNVTWGNSVSYK